MTSRKEYMKTYRDSQKYGVNPENFDPKLAQLLDNNKAAYRVVGKIMAAYKHAKSLGLEEANTLESFLDTMPGVYTRYNEFAGWE